MTMDELRKMDFNEQQLRMLEFGLQRGFDISLYADPAYSAEHMHYINRALGDGFDITRLLDPTLSFETVRQIEFTLMQEDMKANGIEMTEADIKDAHDGRFILS